MSRDAERVPSDFLASGGLGSAMRRMGADLTGQRIGVYEITALIGTGGMGEVYRARDTRLGRDVAIKVLLPEFSSDPDRLARLQREARILAALNHPNIATIHGLEETQDADGAGTARALVMELVEGETLAGRLERGRLPVPEALHIAQQIAEGLEAAHEAGVVHRDLKPANVSITSSKHVKVLDFGLAKLTPVPGEPGASDGSGFPSRAAATREGVLVGTPAYMSPEQARGQPVDKRADIWAFGCVLYEMLSGKRAFDGATIPDTLAAILDRDPDWGALLKTTPAGVVRVVRRCLDKDSRRRLRDIGEARVAIETAGDHPAVPPMRERILRRRPALYGLGAAVSVAGALLLLADFSGPAPADSPPMTAVPLTTYPGHERFPSFSPDGSQVAFAWQGERHDNWDIYVKVAGSADAPLRLTSDPGIDLFPAWSPNGREIAFVRGNSLHVVSPIGGNELRLTDVSVESLSPISWSPDSEWIVASLLASGARPKGIYLVPRRSGTPRQIVASPASTENVMPAISPDGNALAYGSCAGFPHSCDVYVVELEGAAEPFAGRPRRLSRQTSYLGGLTWTPDSRTVVFSAGQGVVYTLWHVSASDSAAEPVRTSLIGRYPAISRQGHRLAYESSQFDVDIWTIDPAGRTQRFISSTQSDINPMFSPDGRRVAFTSTRSGNPEIWVANADGSNAVQLTSSNRQAGSPRWSPDGHWIAYDFVVESGTRDIFVIDSSGGASRAVVEHAAQDRVPSWSSDGRFIYFTSNRNGGADQIFRVPAAGGEAVQITDQGGYVAFESPDGRTLYYTKVGLGSPPLFARPLSGGPERQETHSVHNRAFLPVGPRVYFIAPAGQADGDPALPIELEAANQFRFSVLDTSNGEVRAIATLEGPLDIGLGVTPDGRQALYSRVEPLNTDLMLVENFQPR